MKDFLEDISKNVNKIRVCGESKNLFLSRKITKNSTCIEEFIQNSCDD